MHSGCTRAARPLLHVARRYFTARANYTSAWWGVVNWQQVSRNYEHARRGEAGAIGALF